MNDKAPLNNNKLRWQVCNNTRRIEKKIWKIIFESNDKFSICYFCFFPRTQYVINKSYIDFNHFEPTLAFQNSREKIYLAKRCHLVCIISLEIIWFCNQSFCKEKCSKLIIYFSSFILICFDCQSKRLRLHFDIFNKNNSNKKTTKHFLRNCRSHRLWLFQGRRIWIQTFCWFGFIERCTTSRLFSTCSSVCDWSTRWPHHLLDHR